MNKTFIRGAAVLAACTLFASIGCTSATAQSPTLDTKNLEAWRTHIKPSDEELAWTKIPWLPDLKSGIEEAKKSGKPILLWTMNGHPLGCT